VLHCISAPAAETHKHPSEAGYSDRSGLADLYLGEKISGTALVQIGGLPNDLIEKEFQFKNFEAMKFTTRILQYY